MIQRLAVSVLVLTALLVALSYQAGAQAQTMPRQPRITQAISEARLKTLRGNTHPLARTEFEQGMAPADLPMEHMLLVLSRNPEQETALETLLKQQQDKSTPQYHKWLTPQQFGEQFGAADEDVQAVTSWLQSNGFRVNAVANGKTVIDFSGTAAQVQNAFHTDIHKYSVGGVERWANASDPQIPAALTPVVVGVATLHNFAKKPQLIALNRQFEASVQAGARPQFTNGTVHALAPADYATIYDINPLYQAGVNGTGATIAVVARTNINIQDIISFRSTFGLSTNTPHIIVNGTNPGNLGGDEEAEAVLDTSWAGATAPSATVKLVVSKSTNTSDGVDLSELYIIDNNLGDVMTESFGGCEATDTRADENVHLSWAQQAAAQGITYLVAAGDSGAEGCDDPTQTSATGPLSVNVLASTPYTIAVGGTQFNEGSNASAYWNSTNNSDEASAKSYIPENVWNEACTVAQCGSANAGLWAGGGGASTIFTKPWWQTGVAGIPTDGARDVPDLSLTAAGHDAYLLCLDGSCTPNSRGRISFMGYSGTSAATPSFGGIMALVVQKTGSRQGQANPVLYALAAQQTITSCNGSNTSGLPAADCVFNDVTVGDNAVPGQAGYGTSGAHYQANIGYDLATGLGSVNVTNLVNGWNGAVVGPPFHVYIDQPGQASTFISQSVFSGWAVNDNASITGVQISIDGVPYGAATYGLARPDVCVIYPGGAGCPNVGWSILMDTTVIANGGHTLEVTATTSLGDHFTITGSFTVANWSGYDPVTVFVDAPNSHSGSLRGSVGFGGWAINDTGAIGSVAISIDGVPYGNATYGIDRPDVCAVFPGRAGCPKVGWSFSLDTTALSDGAHTLGVTGFTAIGQNTTVTTNFTTSNLSGNPIIINIDRPNVQSGPFSSAATFSGWALDNTTGVAISSVSLSIDGVPYGNATYGINRPDVCAAFPGRAGCPNVGWNFLLDTLKLANGSHTVGVTATAANGQRATATSTFTVANDTSGTPLKMMIDQPVRQSAVVTGLTELAGWAIDDNGPVTSVAISIDGVPKGNASYDVSRPDVCAVFPGRSGCPNVGWRLALDTTLIPDGSHTLAVTGTSATGDQLTISTTFTIANWTTGNPMRIYIDNPSSQSTAFSGTVTFGGWAISDIASIANVAIAIDGVSFGNASYGASRPDVCAAFPGRSGCPNVGWNFSVNTALLGNGTHTLEVTGTSSGGQNTTLTATFAVSNSTAGPVVIAIDRPNPQNGPFAGTTAFLGWALDTAAGVHISSVQILVDGVFYANAVYGGQRPDVCAVPAYAQASGCPDVGWNYSLDTTLLAEGSHTLAVRATSTAGQQATASSVFDVNNYE